MATVIRGPLYVAGAGLLVLLTNGDTSHGSPLTLTQQTGTKPFFVAPHFAPNHHPAIEWKNPDTSQRAAAVLGGGAKPVFDAPFFASTIHHPQREWLGVPLQNRDNTFIGGGNKPNFDAPVFPQIQHPQNEWLPAIQLPSVAIYAVPPAPFKPQPFLQAPEPNRSVTDTSIGIPKPLTPDASFAFQIEWQQAPEPLRSLADSSRGTPSPLLVVQSPVVNYIFGAIDVARVPLDTSRSSPAPLLAPPPAPVVNYSFSAPQFSQGLIDTSRGTPASLLFQPAPAVNLPIFALDRPPMVFAASFSTPKVLYGDKTPPVSNLAYTAPTGLDSPVLAVVAQSQSTPTPYIPFVPPVAPPASNAVLWIIGAKGIRTKIAAPSRLNPEEADNG